MGDPGRLKQGSTLEGASRSLVPWRGTTLGSEGLWRSCESRRNAAIGRGALEGPRAAGELEPARSTWTGAAWRPLSLRSSMEEFQA